MIDEDDDVRMLPIEGDDEEEEEGETWTLYQLENRQVALEQYENSIIVRLVAHYKVHAAPLIKTICQFSDENGGTLTEHPHNVDILLQRWPSSCLLDRLPQIVRRDEMDLLLCIVLDAELSGKPPLTGSQAQQYQFMQYLFVFLSVHQSKLNIIKRCEKSAKRYTTFVQKLGEYGQRLSQDPITINGAWDAEHENLLDVACSVF